MNQIELHVQSSYRGHTPFLRTASDGEAKPILMKGGKPAFYPTELEALRVGIQHLLDYVNGTLYRDGPVAGKEAVREKAEQLFKPVIKQKGKTRLIKVSKKGDRQRCQVNKGKSTLADV